MTLSLFSEQTGASISPGTPVGITINTPGQDVQLTFAGTANQLASVQLSGSSFSGDPLISILNPDGTTLSSGRSFIGPLTLPSNGTYTLVVAPQNGNTGSAVVSLSFFTDPTPTNIVPGTSTTVTISVPGQSAELTFTGSAGQLASLAVPFGAPVSILSPDGTQLASNGSQSSIVGPITLPSTGTYTVLVAPQNGAIGTYTITLSLFSEQIGTLTSGSPAPITINIPGQEALLSFSGSANQLASVTLSQSTFWNQISMSILSPDGITIASRYSGSFIGPVTLPVNGTYTLVIAPQQGTTGSVTAGLSVFGNQTGGTLSPNTLTPISFSTPGQSVQFSFAGTAGQLSSVDIPNSPFVDGASVTVTNPDGSILDTDTSLNFLGSIFVGPVTLPVNGTYTLTVTPQNGDTGTAGVLLSFFANQTGTNISPLAPLGVNIEVPGQQADLTFSGNAGQMAGVQLSNITFPDQVTISIINPDGTTLSSNFGDLPAYGLPPIALPVTGSYTLVITPQNGTTGSSTVALSLQ